MRPKLTAICESKVQSRFADFARDVDTHWPICHLWVDLCHSEKKNPVAVWPCLAVQTATVGLNLWFLAQWPWAQHLTFTVLCSSKEFSHRMSQVITEIDILNYSRDFSRVLLGDVFLNTFDSFLQLGYLSGYSGNFDAGFLSATHISNSSVRLFYSNVKCSIDSTSRNKGFCQSLSRVKSWIIDLARSDLMLCRSRSPYCEPSTPCVAGDLCLMSLLHTAPVP